MLFSCVFLTCCNLGNGRLSYFLNKSGILSIPIIATDAVVDRTKNNACPVIQLDSETAVRKYKPVTIIYPCFFLELPLLLMLHL